MTDNTRIVSGGFKTYASEYLLNRAKMGKRRSGFVTKSETVNIDGSIRVEWVSQPGLAIAVVNKPSTDAITRQVAKKPFVKKTYPGSSTHRPFSGIRGMYLEQNPKG